MQKLKRAVPQGKQGERRGKRGNTVIYKTVGLCKDCGHTWIPQPVRSTPQKAGVDKIVLWILGWLYIFPIPVTILLRRKKDLNSALKTTAIVASWILYMAIFGAVIAGALTSSGGGAVASSIIKEISFIQDGEINIETGETLSNLGYVKVKIDDRESFKPDDVKFVSENPEIASITFTKDALTTSLYFEVSGISVGETYVYAMSDDGTVSSKKRKVIVNLSENDRLASNDIPAVNGPESTESIENVETNESEDFQEPLPIQQMTARETVNIREQPNTDCEVLGKLIAGSTIGVLEFNPDGWSKVDFNGNEVYINSSYLTTVSEPPSQTGKHSNMGTAT